MSQNQYHFIRWIHLHKLFSGKRITTCIADFTFPLRPMKHLPEERNAILTLLTQSPSKVVVLIQMKLHFYVFNYWPVKNNCINLSTRKSCLDERFTRETAALGLDCCPWTHHGQEQQRGQRTACVCVCLCARMCVCVCFILFSGLKKNWNPNMHELKGDIFCKQWQRARAKLGERGLKTVLHMFSSLLPPVSCLIVASTYIT